MQNSTTKAGLRGIHAVGGGVAWASGTDGTVLRTEDGGYMWQSCAMPPGAEKLDFRGIWAWDANRAVVMSSGPGELSRLYKTTDGCSSWKLLYTNPDKDGFWDAVAFWDQRLGLILGDPVLDSKSNGAPKGKRFVVLETVDGGQHWDRQDSPASKLSAGDAGAGAFAASNSALIFIRGSNVLQPEAAFGSGGRSGPYIRYGRYQPIPDGLCDCFPMPRFHFYWTTNWPVPLASGTDSSGVFSIASGDGKRIVAVGGDYLKSSESKGTAAYLEMGAWHESTKPPHGYRSAVAWDAADKAWIAAGTNGSDISYDDGKTWTSLDDGKWNALSLPWVVGPEGRIGKLVSLKAAGLGKQ
jgi:photosystem II stability/assembly factor-like uncharacterized protein